MTDRDHTRPLVIAELSANHNGSLQIALDTVVAAAEAGADAIKLQTYKPETITLDSDRDEFVVRGGAWDGRRLFELYEEAMLPWEWHGELFEKAKSCGLSCFSSPFDETAVDFLETLDCPIYKIASFEMTHHPLLRKVAETGKPVIMSTGNATLAEIDESVRVLRDAWGDSSPGLTLLRCVSSYPADPKHINLKTIAHLAETFGVDAGLSDHTMGSAVAVAAVALGATVIEKHFILDRSMGGPDSHFSMEPAEFKAMMSDIHVVSDALGGLRYGPTDQKAFDSLRYRRSIYVSADIPKGATLTRENIKVVRPSLGMKPVHFEEVLGMKTRRDLSFGEPLQRDDIES